MNVLTVSNSLFSPAFKIVYAALDHALFSRSDLNSLTEINLLSLLQAFFCFCSQNSWRHKKIPNITVIFILAQLNLIIKIYNQIFRNGWRNGTVSWRKQLIRNIHFLFFTRRNIFKHFKPANFEMIAINPNTTRPLSFDKNVNLDNLNCNLYLK